jgi:hypothetical protein
MLLKEKESTVSHPILYLAAEYLEKPHIAENMHPPPVNEQRCQEREVINHGERPIVSRIYTGHNTEINGELLKEFLRQGGFKVKNNPAKDYNPPCCKREVSIGSSISDR